MRNITAVPSLLRPLSLILPGLVTLVACCTNLQAQTWPKDIDRRLGLQWSKSPAAGDSLYGKFGPLEQFRLIIPDAVVVFDETGNIVPSKTILGRSGKHELWFQAEPKHQYFVGWENAKKTPTELPADAAPVKEGSGKAAPPAKTDAKPDAAKAKGSERKPPETVFAKPAPPKKPAPPEPRLTRPAGWSSNIPVVEVRPGDLHSRPTWKVDQGTLTNSGRRPLDAIVSRAQFRDFELSVRVRPEGLGQCGIAIRMGDSNAVRSGLCWLIAVAKSADQTLGKNQTLGLVRDNATGALLKLQEWNDLKVICRGRSVQLLLNGALSKSLQLPHEGDLGNVALLSDNTPASFDDLKIAELPSQTQLLTEDFSGNAPTPEGLSRSWIFSGQSAGSGFVRVINSGSTPARYEIATRFHQAPFRSDPILLSPTPIDPQQSSPWFWIGSLEDAHPPLTLFIYSLSAPNIAVVKSKANERPATTAGGTIEFVRTLAGREGEYLRRLRLDTGPVVVEVQRSSLLDESDLRTPDEIGEETLENVRKLKFPGKPPQKLPTGSAWGTEADLQAGRLLGINAVTGSPQGFPSAEFTKLGYRYIFGNSHAIETREQGYGYKLDLLDAEMKKLVDAWKATGLQSKVYFLNLFEDAALDIQGQARKAQPVDLAVDPNAWKQMMQVAGLKPEDFVVASDPPPPTAKPDSPEYWAKLQAVHPREGYDEPASAMKSLRLLASIWPTRFRNATESARRAFHRGISTTANIDGDQYLEQGVGSINPWTLFSGPQSLDIAKSRDDSVIDALDEEFLIDLQRSALATEPKPVFGNFAVQSGPRARSAQSLELRGMSALGAGARGLIFSSWGPRWQAATHWYSEDVSRLEAVGRINHAAGWVEDILLDGHPPQGEVGIIVSPLNDLWEFLLRGTERMNLPVERRRLHRLLRGLHYQVDFLNDAALPRDSELDRYRLLIVAQPCSSGETTRRLHAWVNRGGILLGSASIGHLDENCQPAPIIEEKGDPRPAGLLATFGIRGLRWIRGTKRTLQVTPTASINVTGPIRGIENDSAEILSKYSTGEAAITRKKVGKGEAILCGFAIGAAYFDKARIEQDVLKGTQPSVRELIRPWLATTPSPFCRTDLPVISARPIRSYRGNAIFLINSSGAPVSKVRVTVKLSGVTEAESLLQGKLAISRDGAASQFELPLEKTDVIRFK